LPVIDSNREIVFVIAKHKIEARLVLLNQGVLEQERLFRVRAENKLYVEQ
jgi:uncharacterized protein YfkK (UPF0435 family)